MNIKLVLVMAVLFIFAVFIVQNAQVVMVNFLFWKIEASRAIVLMVTFVLGLFTGWVMTKILEKKNRANNRIGE